MDTGMNLEVEVQELLVNEQFGNSIASEEEEKESTVKKKKKKKLYDTKQEPRKALSTFFRNHFKMLVNRMAMADRKAMIMVRINTTIISLLIVFNQKMGVYVENGNVIAIILLIGSGTSLVLSLLTASPIGAYVHRLFKYHREMKQKYPNFKHNSFMMMKRVGLDEYEKSMDAVVRNQDLQIGNQVRASFMLSHYTLCKYQLLQWSYNLFLIAFFISIGILIYGLL
ncbi:Pycsar system effector family protein [Carboxylicivirga taeanensis]|uniref:Pycsar system effector family protein n=1 Tax=Carboxylicivirga taeanensis TaxID=1416875 RepID=UPI003F6DD112